MRGGAAARGGEEGGGNGTAGRGAENGGRLAPKGSQRVVGLEKHLGGLAIIQTLIYIYGGGGGPRLAMCLRAMAGTLSPCGPEHGPISMYDVLIVGEQAAAETLNGRVGQVDHGQREGGGGVIT